MNRLRKSLTILVCAVMLAGLPLREAQAIPLLDQALKILAIPLTVLFAASGKLEGVIMVINTKLPIMLKTVELKQREKLAIASDENRRKIEEKRQQARTAREIPPDTAQSHCTVFSGGGDVATVQAHGEQRAQTLQNDFAVMRNRGTVLGGGLSGRSPSLNPIRGNISEFRDNTCKYANANDAVAYEKLCGKPRDEARTNPYRAANRTATTLTNTGAFDEDRHFIAAMDFCYAMTGNLPLPYAQGRALTENIDNIYQFNTAMSNYAAQDMAAFNCLYPVFRKMPIDGKFARSDPLFQRYGDNFTSSVNTAGQNAGDASNNATEARSLTNIDARARTFLKDQNAGGYVEIDPRAKQVGQPSADAEQALIRGQMVSTEQLQEAEYLYKWYSGQYTSKVNATGKSLKLANIYVTRLYNIQLMWHQYEQLERDVMMEAIQLARLTRQAQRGPNVVTPSN